MFSKSRELIVGTSSANVITRPGRPEVSAMRRPAEPLTPLPQLGAGQLGWAGRRILSWKCSLNSAPSQSSSHVKSLLS